MTVLSQTKNVGLIPCANGNRLIIVAGVSGWKVTNLAATLTVPFYHLDSAAFSRTGPGSAVQAKQGSYTPYITAPNYTTMLAVPFKLIINRQSKGISNAKFAYTLIGH
jgi:hypothetical protein